MRTFDELFIIIGNIKYAVAQRRGIKLGQQASNVFLNGLFRQLQMTRISLRVAPATSNGMTSNSLLVNFGGTYSLHISY